MVEPDPEVDRLAYGVIGAAIEVHRILGPGYLESVYEEALAVEMGQRKIQFLRQVPIVVDYKGQRVGEGKVDFLVGGRLIVELKAVEELIAIHVGQAISYLKATGHPLALLINFNVPALKMGIKRVVQTGIR